VFLREIIPWWQLESISCLTTPALTYIFPVLSLFPPSPNPQRRLRQEVFLREVIPWWLAPVGYGGLAILSIIFIPMVYTPVKWCVVCEKCAVLLVCEV
jgi:hypothetical protein